MKFKMRMLHYPDTGNAQKLAEAMARSQQANADKIPPAYPIENEKLVFIGAELKGSSVDKSVSDLVKDLNTSRAKNVAFYAVSGGNFSAIEELKSIVASKGINVVGSTYECTVKGGLFKKGAVSDADIKGAVDWAEKIIESM